ncbi:MAG TPA: FKBP-type peptidyl-prolyl cis-trans isomerase [Candidatus Saccharimonadia bacterium]
MKRWWWFVGSIVMALGLTGGGLWWFRGQKTSDQVNSVGGTIGLADGSEGSSGTHSSPLVLNTETGTPGASNSGVTSQTSNQSGKTGGSQPLQSQFVDNSTTKSGNTGEKSAPGPAEFGQYDQYKNEQSAYSGDVLLGDGNSAQMGDWLTVNYRGWLTNGTEFDESYVRGKPFVFEMGAHHVIQGWEQGLFGMKAGGKRRLIIPPAVGYGATAQGSIPPNSVLVFDVELVAVSQTKPVQ